MKGLTRTARQLAVQGIAFSLLINLAVAPAWSQQVIKDLDDGVKVELRTEVDGETATVGQPFEAELTEALSYKGMTIPAGTDFRGAITKVQESRRFSRAGYVILEPQEAVLPDGQAVSFTDYGPRSKKLHHEGARTLGRTIVQQIPYTAVSLGTSIPLKTATDLEWYYVSPIALGARMATGAVLAFFNDDWRDDPFPKKIAKGVWRGTGVPNIARFVGREPEPDYDPGEEIKLYFNPAALQALFQAASGGQATTVPAAMETEPATMSAETIEPSTVPAKVSSESAETSTVPAPLNMAPAK